MGERGLALKSDINKEGWEEAEFPIVCETCLGDNPYVRMQKEPFGQACKICDRPFTVFRWKPGHKGRYKKTQVCQTCAKARNVCQTCVLDLEYGLPVQIRDSVLAQEDQLASTVSDANRDWQIQQLNRLEAEGEEAGYTYGKDVHEKLLRLARNKPYYRRNLPHLCSFYARGECSRGDTCPYLHEMPRDKDDPLAKQNIRDRYYGKDDPVAEKLQRRLNSMPELVPPQDSSIKTLWVGGLDESIGREDLSSQFYSFGQLKHINVVPRQKCAFVEFDTREAAEAAATSLYKRLEIKGVRLKLSWAQRPQNPSTGQGVALDQAQALLPPPPGSGTLPPRGPSAPYPSMNPNFLGARAKQT